MEGPETISIEFQKEEKEIKIEDFKIFILVLNDNTYELILEYWSNEKIIIKLRQINILSYYIYTKVYKYDDLLVKFKLNKEDKKDILSLFNYLDKEIIPKIKTISKEQKTIKLLFDNNYLDLYEEKIPEKEMLIFYYYKKCFGKMDLKIQSLNKELKELKESLNSKINNLNEYNILLKKEKDDMEKNINEITKQIEENKNNICKIKEDNKNNINNVEQLFKDNYLNKLFIKNLSNKFQKEKIQNSNNIEENKKRINENKKNIDENKKSIDDNKKNLDENKKDIYENKKKIKDINKKLGKNIKLFEEINKNIQVSINKSENNKKILDCFNKIQEKNIKGIEDNKKNIKKLMKMFNENEDNKNNKEEGNKKKEEKKLTIQTNEKYIKKEIKKKKGELNILTPLKERENRFNKNKIIHKNLLTSKNQEKDKNQIKSKIKSKNKNINSSKNNPEIKEKNNKNNFNNNNNIKNNSLKRRTKSEARFFTQRENKEENKKLEINDFCKFKLFEKFKQNVKDNMICKTEENYEEVKDLNEKRKKFYKKHLIELKSYYINYYQIKRSHSSLNKNIILEEESQKYIKSNSVNIHKIKKEQSLDLTKSQSTKVSLKQEWKTNINTINNFSLKSSIYNLGYSGNISEHKHRLIYTDYLGKSLKYGKKNWSCGICENKFNYDINNFYCDICEYDVCRDCFEKKQIFKNLSTN